MGGFDQMLARFTTDIPYLSNWGKALLIGPGSILDAHTDGEKIRKSDLTKAVELYVELVKAL
jgi:acetylornithine deacetylase